MMPTTDLIPAAEFEQIKAAVAELATKADAITVTDATQLTEMKQARAMRLHLKDLRCKVETRRKEIKADYLEAGRLIDKAAAHITALIEPHEQRMLEAETFAERAEKARKTKLAADRAAELAPFGVDTRFLVLEDMPEAAYQSTLAGAKAAHAAQVAKERADAEKLEGLRRENERLQQAQAAEEARLRAENERLRAERLEADKAAAAKLRKAHEAARAEREAREQAEAQAQAAYYAQLQKDREAEEAQEAALKAAAAAKRKAERAPDNVKLEALAAALMAIEMPKVRSDEAGVIVAGVRTTLANLASRIRTRIAELDAD